MFCFIIIIFFPAVLVESRMTALILAFICFSHIKTKDGWINDYSKKKKKKLNIERRKKKTEN